MEIANEFTVSAPAASVYTTLLDFQRVAPCIPGASIGQADEQGAYAAEIAVRLGPMRLTYRGTVRLEETNESERRAKMVADVREIRGQGTARAQMWMTVSERGGGSHVASSTDVQLSGRAAQMGAGIVEDVAARLIADMASNLERLLGDEAQGPVPPADPSGATDPADGAPARPVPATPVGAAPLAPPPAARPISGFRLLVRVLWQRLRHRVHRASRQTT